MTISATHTPLGRTVESPGARPSASGRADSAHIRTRSLALPPLDAVDAVGLTSQLRLSAGRLYRRLRLHGHTTTGAIPIGLLCALDTLHRRGELSPGELAAAEQIQRPSTTRIINTLVRAGLISRQEHQADRRQAVLRITPAGVRLLTAETTARERWLDQRLGGLSCEERKTLTQATHIINILARGRESDPCDHQEREDLA
jgi:DNA-binding MarR family transcriptional regulator